ncbi:MAG: 2-amino-4-hydroxy-6-hydroxymethyldihydropteridine diphosphokinase [Crocinitomicaceae bacterium]|nr:2-amino-4-hydroxy-6-hydroxymethyldihydropteridine diphosphokinase [Crocinitomicaceae bacterium]
MNSRIYIGLGSNLGDRLANIENAINLIKDAGFNIIRKSSVYVSPPWGFEAKLDFYNAVLEIQTNLGVLELLNLLKQIEVRLGRKSKSAGIYESRLIDLDIIDFHGKVLQTDTIQIPHPRMDQRLFVLVPLSEIAPEWTHPLSGLGIKELLGKIAPTETISKLTVAND